MATLNVGALAARLGLDTGDFLEKMKGVSGATQFFSNEMARSMKQTSREGAEAFRLIDEAIGIRVSRPLTRILTQEFPKFAEGLQAILGGAVLGAVAGVGVEAFDKIEKTIEKAQKAEEEFAQSTRKVGLMFAEAMGAYEKSQKLRSLSGLDKELFKVDSRSLEEASKNVGALSEAMEKNTNLAREAASPWNQFWAAVGNFGHTAFSLGSTLGVEQIDKQMQSLRESLQEISIASQADPLRGLHESLKTVQTEFDKADAAMKKMTADQVAAAAVQLIDPESGANFSSAPSPSGKETAAQQRYLDNLQKLITLLQAAEKDNTGAEAEAAKADAAERQLKAQRAIASMYKEMGSSLAKLQPETDPIAKLHAEINTFRSEAVTAFVAVGNSAGDALQIKGAHRALENYLALLDRVKSKLEADILSKQAFELLNKPPPGGVPTGTALPISIATSPVVPTLGAGGTTGAQFDEFAKNTQAQNALIAKAFADAISPTEEYQLKVSELRLAFANLPAPLKDSAQAQQAFNAEMAKLEQQSTKAQLRLKEMQKQLDELLSHSTSAGDGVKAFFLQLQIESSQNGKFAFDMLNHGLKGFEDTLTKAVFEGKAKWKDLFRSMTEEAFKFLLNKEISGMFQMFGNTGIGKSLTGALGGNVGSLAAAAGKDAAQAANTTALAANTAAVVSLTARMTLASAGGAGAFSGGGALDNPSLPIPFFAEGGDATPGSSFISGEAGAEEVDLDRSGGAHITPLESGRAEMHIHNFDMRGAVVSDDLMRKADAAALLKHAEPAFIGKALANFAEVQRRTPQR